MWGGVTPPQHKTKSSDRIVLLAHPPSTLFILIYLFHWQIQKGRGVRGGCTPSIKFILLNCVKKKLKQRKGKERERERERERVTAILHKYLFHFEVIQFKNEKKINTRKCTGFFPNLNSL